MEHIHPHFVVFCIVCLSRSNCFDVLNLLYQCCVIKWDGLSTAQTSVTGKSSWFTVHLCSAREAHHYHSFIVLPGITALFINQSHNVIYVEKIYVWYFQNIKSMACTAYSKGIYGAQADRTHSAFSAVLLTETYPALQAIYNRPLTFM